jgi:cytochrome oxidase Cu insertion factor (SCO1/SenC/PrrC family)
VTRPQALLAVLLAVFVGPAQAQLYPALKPGLIPGGVAVVDERGRPRDMGEILPGPAPVVLLPIFTKCQASCPVLAQNLKAALEGRRGEPALRVIVFSFDATDTDASLRAFRREMALPSDWTLVRAVRPGGALGYLDQFGYAVMQSDGGFVHPNEALVFSSGGRWSAILLGTDFSSEALDSAARGAMEIDRPTLLSRFKGSFSDPQSWAAWSGAALALLAAGVVFLTLRRGRSRGAGRGGR